MPPGARVYAQHQPQCVSCDRLHSRLRYCHVCGCELFNAFFECTDEDCPWEACAACCEHRPWRAGAAGGACAHVALRSHLLHCPTAEVAALLQSVKRAAEMD